MKRPTWLDKLEKSRQGFTFMCPDCGSVIDLQLEVSCLVKIVQTPDEGDFVTEMIGEIDYDRRSFARCNACEYDGKLRDFELPMDTL